MTAELASWSGWQKLDPATALLVFPGNGASIVRGYIPEKWLNRWQWVGVHAKRYWKPGEEPQVVANRIFPERLILGVKDVVVIDDVFSSGKTARLLRQLNEPWFPGAEWHAVAWIKQRSASLRGFASSYAVVEVGTVEKKVPVNSLSTLLADQSIAESYAWRNLADPNEFLQLLAEIRAGQGGK
ncbi:MAG: hypothetical protein WC480_04230 [Patescibacteria group bacterium]